MSRSGHPSHSVLERSDMSKRDCYVGLFSERGGALSDADWIARANDSLPLIFRR